MSRLISNILGSISNWRYSEIDSSLNSRLYITLSPILIYLRKPWKGHSWYSATSITSVTADGLREVLEVQYCFSTKVDEYPLLSWDCALLISTLVIGGVGEDCRKWRGGVTAYAKHDFYHFAGCGSSLLVSQALWLLSVFAELWVLLLISIYIS